MPTELSQPAPCINGRYLTPGTEVSITGQRGRFRYIDCQTAKSGALVLNFVGGTSGHEKLRSFHPDRVKTVHRKRVTRGNTP